MAGEDEPWAEEWTEEEIDAASEDPESEPVNIVVSMYGEVAIAFAPFQVGERAHFPIDFWLKHRRYLRVVPDGESGDQPHEG